MKMIRYTGAGLKNIYLVNGYQIRNTRYGKAVSVEDVEGLHQAIGLYLVENKSKLTGAELRFLRKEMDMSQKQLGQLIGINSQTIALWEKTGKVQAYGDRFVRALYKGYLEEDVRILDLVKRINEIDRQITGKFIFEETKDGWVPNAA